VHIPFCHYHCGYCNFTLIANRNELIDAYLDALAIDLQSLQTPRQVATIFVGGGTPSLLDNRQTLRLFGLLSQWFPLESVREFSIEVNPNDVAESKVALWKSLGVNRVSVGGQSFQSAKLKLLERDHSPDQLQESLRMLTGAMPRVALDLIFGVPGETTESWDADLDSALALGIKHLSTYGLTFEKGSRFWGMREKGVLISVDEEVELKMYQSARQKLLSRGYDHYEVSNFAFNQEQCLHNETYWNGQSYWAFGAGAAYFVDSRRGVKHRSTTTYIKKLKKGESPVAEEEQLSEEQVIRERFVFGMRKLRGVELATLGLERYPDLQRAVLSQIDAHIEHGWMGKKAGRVALTEAGLWVSDSLWRYYL
jgi:oxygen-independent coproporphyrinogen-3 oxidase